MKDINNDSLNPTSKLKSSPISIDFISFSQNDINCIKCGNKYSETLLFEQKYCKRCLLLYINKTTTDNCIYLDLHIATINSQCSEHKTRSFFTQEWCDNCSIISFFKQIPTNSLAIYDDDISFEEQNIIIENEKNCKFCEKIIYETSYEKLKICSDCYPISYDFMVSSTTKETIPIFYLPWWDTFYVCIICKAELICDNNQKWCPHCFIIYSGCRYCLTTNIIFGYTDQSHCKSCKRVMSITTTISIENDEIDDFIYNKRNIINNCDINVDYMKDIIKYGDNPLNVYDFLKEKIYFNFNPEAIMEWIPYSQIKILSQIAEEGFNIIYKGIWMDGGVHGAKYSNCNRKKREIITVKKFINSKDINRLLLHELRLYYQCYNKSCHILRYYGVTKNDETNEYMLVMKYIDGENLHDYLRKNFKNITWKEKLEILLQISNGLRIIHDANLVHQNFHSKNILLDKSYKSYQKWQFGQWLIGLSQPADNILSNKVSYDIAPEIFKGTAFSKNSDVYSMGMVMWELTSGYKPFANIEHNTSLIDDIINGTRPEITDDTPDCFGNLIKSCWHYNPTDRPSISDICKTIDDWLIMEKNVELFSLAEEKRLESIQLEKLNTESTNKCYSKVDCNKSLKSLISGSLSFSMNLFNMKLEHSLRELEKNDIQSSSSEYVTNTLILSKNPSSKHSIEDEIQNNEKRIKI
ncbi:kinase-like domain-containing protein [Rhizophagus irregularis DAOM 181602=DAOM 197198]|uniref:Kinase-like domain-containing protein n=3 Tax=Rhizophagus irregularis TaxID=588596 RepID=A0A2H5T6H2_RHIID|nr:kinase-like domain-containing protein [Rhizophagus irregularis DAOM 181602=DAOM 197198]POG77029.1 kinase-like domain-containing protein [Rhizophagus irregularis DAOM 181602=DAOM 197198]GBC38162.1 kinase-like domain-containing protein [Rhizophagus irregularis DAOM 181602=DAOM 197198]|eukprot:XP_025183895.1 kinase-like domain-containing protein [Rhizophagus irregularis DAOM 181602=DAOM 197198]